MVTNADETGGPALDSAPGGEQLAFAPEPGGEAIEPLPQAEGQAVSEGEQPPVTGAVAPQAPTSVDSTPPAPTMPPATDYAELQAKAAQYEQVRMQQALESQATQYQQQLQAQGYSAEDSQQAARAYMQTQAVQADLVRKGDEYGRHLIGRQEYAEQMAVKYNLGLGDLGTLRQTRSPEEMEAKARDMSGRRKEQDELARYRQSQVPAQQFDNSQGTPTVASNEAGWLDRYNSGDRSSSAMAAARKAAGLG
jgi:hypothetical protein